MVLSSVVAVFVAHLSWEFGGWVRFKKKQLGEVKSSKLHRVQAESFYEQSL